MRWLSHHVCPETRPSRASLHLLLTSWRPQAGPEQPFQHFSAKWKKAPFPLSPPTLLTSLSGHRAHTVLSLHNHKQGSGERVWGNRTGGQGGEERERGRREWFRKRKHFCIFWFSVRSITLVFLASFPYYGRFCVFTWSGPTLSPTVPNPPNPQRTETLGERGRGPLQTVHDLSGLYILYSPESRGYFPWRPVSHIKNGALYI